MAKTISSGELAAMTGGELKGKNDIIVTGVSSLKYAKPEDASFLGNKKYKSQLESSKASVIFVPKDYDCKPIEGKAFIVCDNPDHVFTKAVIFFAPEPIRYVPGIHPSAVVSDKAQIMENVHIGPNAVIEEGVVIGKNTVICAGVYVGHFTKIGENTLIYPNVCIRERCLVGNRVIIHPNATVGSDGFGFAPGPKGIVKIPQTGIVQIDDDVEIGSNCTIDRARFGKTWLKQGVKVDNLVQIAHNVIIGEFSMLISQCGVAGSAELGRGVIVAAKGGVNGHITIGDGAKIAGTSGVVKSVPPGAEVVGTPAEPPREFMERLTLPKKVKKMADRIDELENQLLQLKARFE